MSTPTANEFLLQVQLSQLQSEIYEVQFFDQTISEKFPSYEDWSKHMEDRILGLLDRALSSNGAVSESMTNTALHSQHLLHRPCSRNMAPTQASLLKATTIGISLISNYCRVVETSSLYSTFQVANHAFQAGILLLYVLGNHRLLIQEADLEHSLRVALHDLIRSFVSKVSETIEDNVLIFS